MNKLIEDIIKINELGTEIQHLDDSINCVSSPELQMLYTEKMDEILEDYTKLCKLVKSDLEVYLDNQKKSGEPIELNYYRLLKELRNDKR